MTAVLSAMPTLIVKRAIFCSGVITRYQLAKNQSTRLTQHHDVRLWPATVRYAPGSDAEQVPAGI